MISLVCMACQGNPPTATITVSLDGLKETNPKLVDDGMLSIVYNSVSIPLEAGEDGLVHITLDIKKPGYYMIFRNPLYISPGDDLHIALADKNQETVVTGKGQEANTYLSRRYYSKGGSYLDAGRYARKPIAETIVFLDSTVDARRGDLAALTGVTDEFRDMEEMRIMADYVNSLAAYTSYNQNAVQVPQDATREEYDKIIADFYAPLKGRIQPVIDKIVSDDKYLDIEVARVALIRFMRINGFEVNVSDRYREILDVADEAGRIRGQITPEKYEEFFRYGEQIKTPDVRERFMAKLTANSRLVEGMPAVDFAVADVDGKKGMLSDYKGKPIYIDVWATWCGPCKAEGPYYRALSAMYPGVQFISVSVDGDTRAWEKEVRAKDHGAVIELLSTDDMRRAWDIGGIPRFILIDKDFNIISADAPRPSNRDNITAALDKLSTPEA